MNLVGSVLMLMQNNCKNMKLLEDYKNIKDQIFEYFGYKENWACIPIEEDSLEYYWELDENSYGGGEVRFSESKEDIINREGDYYSDIIYTQRHLSKWVYRGEDYTMICVDTQCDGNKFLRIFKNDKELK